MSIRPTKTCRTTKSRFRVIKAAKTTREGDGYKQHALPVFPHSRRSIDVAERRLVIDFETFSEVNVRDVGAAVYAEHPSTEILCMAWKFKPDGERGLWAPGTEFPKPVLNHIAAKGLCEAHGVQFETNIWKNLLWRASHVRTYGKQYPLPPIPMPTRWTDTMASCAYRALPLGLEDVGRILHLDIQKMKEGKAILRKIAQPRKPTKKDPSTRLDDWEVLEQCYEYCEQDVDAEEGLGTILGDLPASEYRVWVLDQIINNRGIQIDTEAVEAALRIRDHIFEELEAELQELSGGTIETGKQVAKISAWLDEHGCFVPNLQKETVAATIEGLEKEGAKEPGHRLYPAYRMLQIRQHLGSASNSKLDKLAMTVCDNGRCQGLVQYHGAGTGRWSGRGFQPHNLPRGSSVKNRVDPTGKPYLDMERLIEHIKTCSPDEFEMLYPEPIDAIGAALRGMMIAAPGRTLNVADFAAIEARGVMWMAKEKDALQAFREYDKDPKNEPDIYCVTASKVFGVTVTKADGEKRQQGKVQILGCGYQMGPDKLKFTAKKDYGIDLSDEQAEFMVNSYRDLYSGVPRLWYGVQEAAEEALSNPGNRYVYSYVSFETVDDAAGRWLTCILPNGRRLWYYNAEMRKVPTSWGDMRWQVTYEGRDNKRGGSWQRVSTYGGMLTENIVQALSRDLMVEAMFRVEKAGYEIILTVHDEIIAESDENFGSLEEFEALMRGPVPSWAPGFPVGVGGWRGPRYRKG